MWETPNDCRFVSISLPLISWGSEYFSHSRAEVMDSDWLLSLLHTFVTERFPSAEGGFWCIIKKLWFGLKTVDVQFDQLDLNDPSDLHFLFLIFFFLFDDPISFFWPTMTCVCPAGWKSGSSLHVTVLHLRCSGSGAVWRAGWAL